jgi:hypothetical protein
MAALAIGWPGEHGLFCQLYSVIWSAFIAMALARGIDDLDTPANGLVGENQVHIVIHNNFPTSYSSLPYTPAQVPRRTALSTRT